MLAIHIYIDEYCEICTVLGLRVVAVRSNLALAVAVTIVPSTVIIRHFQST